MTLLKVATCQFPVSADIEQNAGWITRQMHEAARQGARVAHFPEDALSGYAGADFETFTGYDWAALDRATDRIRQSAGELGIWVAIGSAHRFSDVSAPHNSLYVISDGGEVTDGMTSGSSAAPTWITTARAATSAPGPSTGSSAGR